MEGLNTEAEVNPYESVCCSFLSYGSCTRDLAEGWKYRSHLWYGVGLPSEADSFGGGGSGWESWKSALQKDENGNWVELPLVRKSIAVLQALLLNEPELGGGLGIGGGSGARTSVMAALCQLLDSDQPFFCMLRMVLLLLREDDEWMSGSLSQPPSGTISFDNISQKSIRQSHTVLLWRSINWIHKSAFSLCYQHFKCLQNTSCFFLKAYAVILVLAVPVI